MRVCGVEIKGEDAIICLMALENNLFDIPHIRVPKIALSKGVESEHIRKFQFAFKKLIEDYKIDKIVIKERATKGKFAGGSQGFKIEAALQLIDDVEVELLRPNIIKERLNKAQVSIDFRDTGLKQFQQGAFETVFASFQR
ncbi:DUF3010 family protein [Thalassotalea aquiviva]|uniref:DUF3010 family protein n=1 Tax=Thalassotalea aquiviva TaxID=3242415 RepID=UPI00352B4964